MTVEETLLRVPGALARRRRMVATIVAIGSGLAGGTCQASAATYTAHDGASLTAALQSADSQAGPSTIDLTPGVYAPDAPLTIARDITITGPAGPGLKIVGSAVMPVGASLFLVNPGADATFINLDVATAGSVGGHAAVDVSGAIDLENSTLAGNAGPDLTVEPGATAIVRDSTLSDGLGAGLVDDGKAQLINTTVADNAVEGIDDSVGTLSLVNTIVAGNGSPDCSAPAASTDHSLDSDGSCGVGALSHLNPQLGPLLASNGGPTPTQALAPGSPAVDSGDQSACPADDQRHYARPAGQCDIGAYQAGAQAPASPPAAASGIPPSGASGGSGSSVAASPSSNGVGAGAPGTPGGEVASGHGLLGGPRRTQIRFTFHARAATPHGSLIYHDAAGHVWLKALSVGSVQIDSGRGTVTIAGSGMDLVVRRRVSFVAVVTDHAGARGLRIRLSSGYVGGGPVISGVITLPGAATRAVVSSSPRPTGG